MACNTLFSHSFFTWRHTQESHFVGFGEQCVEKRFGEACIVPLESRSFREATGDLIISFWYYSYGVLVLSVCITRNMNSTEVMYTQIHMQVERKSRRVGRGGFFSSIGKTLNRGIMVTFKKKQKKKTNKKTKKTPHTKPRENL